MLELITGRAGTGKTAALYRALEQEPDGGEKPSVFIVPEQFSFDTERKVLEYLGTSKAQRTEVLSFRRLPDFIFRKTGGIATERSGEGTETVLMFYCLSQLKDRLRFYSGQTENPQFVRKMLLTVSELDHGMVTPEILRQAGEKSTSGIFRDKLEDIALIQETFEALHGEKLDSEKRVFDSLTETLEKTEILKGYSIFIDGFKGFTGQEFKVLEILLKQAENVRITLCTDDIYSKNGFSIFAPVNETGKRLIDTAKRNNIKVYIKTPADYGCAFERFRNPELRFLEENLFFPTEEKYSGKNGNIRICEAKTVADECSWVAAAVRKLIREENMRCRDIAVVARDENAYRKDLLAAFRRYDIPVFDDSRQPIQNQPLFTLCSSVFSILGYGFREESLIRYLKTGLSPVSDREVSLIENYTVKWDLKGSDWKREFTLHPDGLGYSEDRISKEKLENLNCIRRKITDPLTELVRKTKDSTPAETGKAFYDFLIKTEVPLKLKDFACFYDSEGLTELAKEQNTCWDLLMGILDQIQLALPEIKVPVNIYAKLFEAVVSITDYGTIPQGLDEITVGSAGRVRLADPKVLFAVGCTEGVFPGIPSYSGLLTAEDRTFLRGSGIELAPPETMMTCEEEFIAYSVLSAPSEKLFLSCPLMDSSGDPYIPSSIIDGTESLFGKETVINSENLPLSWFSETPDSLLRSFAESIRREDRDEEATLKTVLETCENGEEKVRTLENAGFRKAFRIEDSNLSSALFGRELYLSASKIDTYYECPFKYFCRYGLKAEPLRKATLDPMQSGSLIHYILEVTLREHSKEEVEKSSPGTRRKWIEDALETYVKEKMGGFEDKTERFIYLTRRIADSMADILGRIAEEMKVSLFVPTDFELEIGKSGEGIPAYELPLENGGKICINGYVDRVDTYRTEDRTFIRVVDYKSGGKDFDLTEILYGLNMQMLIYLFAIEKGGQKFYGDNLSPAGIFYYPAKRITVFQEKKNMDEDELRKQKLKEGIGSGLFVENEEALDAMEHDLKGEFIPVRWKKPTKAEEEEGIKTLTGETLVSERDIRNIHKEVDLLIKEMGNSLHGGMIDADPVLKGAGTSTASSPCDYCDYFSVCRREEPPEREIFSMKTDETLEKIREDLRKGDEENV